MDESLTADFKELNSRVNLWDEHGKLQLGEDKKAARAYFLQHVNPNTHYFQYGLEEKLHFLVKNDYYERDFLAAYDPAFIKRLFRAVYAHRFRFPTFVGAYKFYTGYALKTRDGSKYLERYEDRIAIVALYLAWAQGGDPHLARAKNVARRQQTLVREVEKAVKAAGGTVQAGDLPEVNNPDGVEWTTTRELDHYEQTIWGHTPKRELTDDEKKAIHARERRALELAEEMITQRYQPATPTFLNAGRRARGEMVSCFLQDIADDLNSINRAITTAVQLSARGGGVAFNLSNVRAVKDPIKGIEGAASGVLPIMKIFEDELSYANQLGARQGAGAVYLNVFHLDILQFLDCRREAADEKIRIKTLSLGVVIPDIFFELMANDEDMYMFSPYDVAQKFGVDFSYVNITKHYRELVDDPSIRKEKINARKLFTLIAETQFESGYPYIMFEDNANRMNPVSGKIVMSNLCSEILQPSRPSAVNDALEYTYMGKDISCNLGSLNIASVMDGEHFGKTIETAIRALTAVSDMCDISSAPSIQHGNSRSHAVGLGAMNFHGYIAREHIHYDSPQAVEFADAFFRLVNYHSLWASSRIARERGETFEGFADSAYASGAYFDQYTEQEWQPRTKKVQRLFEPHGLPSVDDWHKLKRHVQKYGLYNQNRLAIAPTGSISYVNYATASIHPITAMIESRKEGKMGRVYYPAAYLSNDNIAYFKTAYQYSPQAQIDVYAAATKHVDQGLSCTLHFPEKITEIHPGTGEKTERKLTTADLNRAQLYAWSKGLKTLYYNRIETEALEGTEMEGCVSCAV